MDKWLVCILFVLWFFLGMIAIQLQEIINILEKKPIEEEKVKFKDIWSSLVWFVISVWLGSFALSLLIRDALY